MPRYCFILLFLLLCLTGLTGCGKEEPPAAPETTQAALQDTAPQEQKTTFDYGPGSLGFYVKASLNIEAGPEVLDSITMTLSDQQKELTRCRVSNRQFDFVKNGHQMGGFLLVDIPAGAHEVELRYTPPGLVPGIGLGVLAAAGLALTYVMQSYCRRKNRGGGKKPGNQS